MWFKQNNINLIVMQPIWNGMSIFLVNMYVSYVKRKLETENL